MRAGSGMCSNRKPSLQSSHKKPRLFIVDGIISLPIALAGFIFIPDVPETSRAPYLSEDVMTDEKCCDHLLTFLAQDRAFSRKRMELEGRKPRAPYTKAKVKKILTSWHIYALSALYV